MKIWFISGISTNSGLAFSESKSINLSLSTLGKVIQCLSSDKPSHIPYRESKLTRILQVRYAYSENRFFGYFTVFHMYFYMFTYLRLSPEIGFMLYTFVGNIKMQRILKVMNKHLRIYNDLRLQLFQLISFPICHIKIWRLWGKHTVCKLFGKYSYY